MNIPLLQVDAFADDIFEGNPASVCLLLEWPAESLLQAIAAENNQSETAFLVPIPGGYRLRWFTPAKEVDLCGHATLAAAYVVFSRLQLDLSEVTFDTRSGRHSVTRTEDLLTINFPQVIGHPIEHREDVAQVLLGAEPSEMFEVPPIHGTDYFMVVYGSADDVAGLRPDTAAMFCNVIVTAPAGAGATHDFVSRFLAPASAGGEDPVTGSAHCTLAPYWSHRLGKNEVVGRQISERGGTIVCEVRDDRVLLSGRCALYLEGNITLPTPTASSGETPPLA